MKFIGTMAGLRRMALACMLIGTLTSCGGGGGDSTTTSAPKPGITSFLQINPLAGFSWSTSQQTTPTITLTRMPGAALGNLTVLLSNYVCDGSNRPVRGGLFRSFSLTPSQQATTSVTLGSSALKLQIPAAATYVLVEVVDNNRKIVLYSQLVAPAALALAPLAISVPDVPALSDCPG